MKRVTRQGGQQVATYIEVIDFEEFKQVHTHKLEADAKMAAENDVIV